jgi:long-subunit fatty acid transport protein
MKPASIRLNAAACVLAVFAAPATAQQPPDIQNGPPPVSYSFAPPGARSLAMGASFIGLADDATASESNPAGLTILTRPEVSAHFRYSSLESEVPNTVMGSGFETFTDQVGSPSFFSFVYPTQSAAFSLYYQRAADYRSHSFFDGVIQGPGLPNYDQVETEFEVENVGLSAAVKLGSLLSVGASARLTRLSLDSLQKTTFPQTFQELELGLLFRGYIEPRATESKFTWNAGALFTPVAKLSVGAVYKKGARYDFSSDFVVDITDGIQTEEFSRVLQPVPLRVPDVYGGGLALRATESWTVLADLVRIRYSQADNGPGFQNIYQQAGEGGREALEDATEFHAGTEYTWAGGSDWLFAARAGFYTDPDHDGLAGVDSDQTHFTLGGGFVVKNRVQLDVAGNFAERLKEGLVSLVVRF